MLTDRITLEHGADDGAVAMSVGAHEHAQPSAYRPSGTQLLDGQAQTFHPHAYDID